MTFPFSQLEALRREVEIRMKHSVKKGRTISGEVGGLLHTQLKDLLSNAKCSDQCALVSADCNDGSRSRYSKNGACRSARNNQCE